MSVRAHSERRAGVARDREMREKYDFYPTPPEGTEALLSVENFDGAIWECACGDGAISRVLERHGHEVVSTDLVDRGYGTPRIDFLMEWKPLAANIITNPPFKNNADFMRKALSLTTGKVAFLMRLACLEGGERGRLYKEFPPARIWVFSKRLQIWRNGDPTSSAGGMIGFAWFVWDKDHRGQTQIGWINPADSAHDDTLGVISPADDRRLPIESLISKADATTNTNAALNHVIRGD